MIAPALRTPGTEQPTNPEPAGETRPENHVDTATDAVPVNPDGAVVPLVSADQIHGDLMQAFRNGNRARLQFVRLLNAMEASRLYLELGHPNIAHYAERQFGMQRSETFEMLRVSRIIDERPLCRDAFTNGELSWSGLKMITRVASTETEEAWLSFAAEHSRSELAAEVQDAAKKNRDRPRDDRFGLPNLNVRFTVELTREEHARLRTALEKAGAEMAPSMGETQVEPRDVLLYLAERFLRTDVDGTPAGRTARTDSPYVIVYQQCKDCGRARVVTEDGPVEVPAERVNQLADAARETVEEKPDTTGNTGQPDEETPSIDRPNSTTLSRKVKLRDGGHCQNPGCQNRGPLHAHHIHHRARGGRTSLSNEVSVCATCHALIHAGLLEVTGDPVEGLAWRSRSQRLVVMDRSDERSHQLAAIPITRTESAIADSADKSNPSTPAWPTPPAHDLDALAGALVQLGLGRKDARSRVEHAWLKLKTRGEKPDPDRILTLAIAG